MRRQESRVEGKELEKYPIEHGCPQPAGAKPNHVQSRSAAKRDALRTASPYPSQINWDAPYALCVRPEGKKGFTLLEVMIAMAVFFMVVFAVLGIVVQSLGAARALQRPQPDFSILASALTLSNCLDEGVESGDFGELTDEFKDYYWERNIMEVGGSNGLFLFQVDFAIFQKNSGGKDVREDMSILMCKPRCKPRR